MSSTPWRPGSLTCRTTRSGTSSRHLEERLQAVAAMADHGVIPIKREDLGDDLADSSLILNYDKSVHLSWSIPECVQLREVAMRWDSISTGSPLQYATGRVTARWIPSFMATLPARPRIPELEGHVRGALRPASGRVIEAVRPCPFAQGCSSRCPPDIRANVAASMRPIPMP